MLCLLQWTLWSFWGICKKLDVRREKWEKLVTNDIYASWICDTELWQQIEGKLDFLGHSPNYPQPAVYSAWKIATAPRIQVEKVNEWYKVSSLAKTTSTNGRVLKMKHKTWFVSAWDTAALVEGRRKKQIKKTKNQRQITGQKKNSLFLPILLLVPFLLESSLWSLKKEIGKNSLQQREQQGLWSQANPSLDLIASSVFSIQVAQMSERAAAQEWGRGTLERSTMK